MKIKSFFSIFTKSGDSFEGEEEGEKVVLLIRRHPFFILARLGVFALMILVPVTLGSLFYSFFLSHNLLEAFFFASSIWYLLLWLAIFYALTMYTLDVWIVTDRRIIDSMQHGFFSRTISELHLSRIQDITVQTKGVIQTVLKFGDLHVQTAGTEDKFFFSQIPHPERVKDEIMRLASVHSSPHL